MSRDAFEKQRVSEIKVAIKKEAATSSKARGRPRAVPVPGLQPTFDNPAPVQVPKCTIIAETLLPKVDPTRVFKRKSTKGLRDLQ